MAAKKPPTDLIQGDVLKGAVAGYLAHKQLKLGLVESLFVGIIAARMLDKKPTPVKTPAQPKELPATAATTLKSVADNTKVNAA